MIERIMIERIILFQVLIIAVFILLCCWVAYLLYRQKRMAQTDSLTGLLNGRMFRERGELEVRRALRYGHSISVAYIDIDNFKGINASRHYAGGDALLRSVAQTITNGIRKTDIAARIGGDEFAIIFPEATITAADAGVQRVRELLRTMRTEKIGSTTFSIGVTTNTGAPCSFEDLLQDADRKMGVAKKSGKDAVEAGIFQPD